MRNNLNHWLHNKTMLARLGQHKRQLYNLHSLLYETNLSNNNSRVYNIIYLLLLFKTYV